MSPDYAARATVDIEALPSEVWRALTDPETIRMYMFGARVTSSWKEGASITWEGEWKGEAYQDRGTILQFEPEQLLQFTHYSPLSGLPDSEENYHTVTIELRFDGRKTSLWLSQDNNPTEEARDHSQANWNSALAMLKEILED